MSICACHALQRESFKIGITMKSFYQNWLERNKKENSEARQALNRVIENEPLSNQVQRPTAPTSAARVTSPIPSTSEVRITAPIPSNSQGPVISDETSLIPSTSRGPVVSNEMSPIPSTSRGPVVSNTTDIPPRNRIFYRNDKLELYIEKGSHMHQQRFRLQDHIFYMKIKLVNPKKNPPLLRDILQFLEEAFNHVLRDIRRFYKPEDHNIAFLTLYQHPMINGLNTGEGPFK